MQKRMVSVCLIFAIVCMIFLGQAFASSVESEQYTIDVAYEFPIVPGTDAWASLTDFKSKVDACEIPEDILRNMTTEALVETVINYPLSTTMYHYENVQQGYNALKNHFNGLQELERRTDGIECLAKYNSATSGISRNEKGLEDFVAEDLYSMMSSNMNVPTKRYSKIVSVYTPANSEVHAEVGHTYADSNTTYEKALASFEADKLIFPDAIPLSGPDSNYNCSSYALYDSSTSNNKWLEHIGQYGCNKYFTDGSYTEITRPGRGNIFVYGYNATSTLGPTHVGIVETIYRDEPSRVISKWGCSGLWDHYWMDCSYVEETNYHYEIYELAG